MAEVFTCEIQPRVRDLNAGGHVDNVEALRVVDEARVLFLRFAPVWRDGAAPGLLARVPAGVAELVGAQRVEYHAEMRFAAYQPFLVRCWVSRVGRSSFDLSCEVRVAPDHAPAVVCATSFVLWDRGADRSWELDDTVRGDLERYLDAPVRLRG